MTDTAERLRLWKEKNAPNIEDRRISKTRKTPVREHGTKAGYVAHKRRKEESCEPCKQAWSAYYRMYRLKYEERKSIRNDGIPEVSTEMEPELREWILAQRNLIGLEDWQLGPRRT